MRSLGGLHGAGPRLPIATTLEHDVESAADEQLCSPAALEIDLAHQVARVAFADNLVLDAFVGEQLLREDGVAHARPGRQRDRGLLTPDVHLPRLASDQATGGGAVRRGEAALVEQ